MRSPVATGCEYIGRCPPAGSGSSPPERGCPRCRRSLAHLGLTEPDLLEVTAQAQAQPHANPRPVTEDAPRGLLTDAFHGVLAP
ncbi:hypothetical protein [Streptomyces sp. NPDC054834]